MTQDKNVIFDAEFGINQLSGNKDLLIKMLDRFSADYSDISHQLQALVAKGDHDDGKAKAHAIKGVAGNLGFWNLHHASKILEDLFRDGGGDPQSAVDQFSQSFDATIAAITAFKQGDAPAASVPPSATPNAESTDTDALTELTSLLESFEFIDSDRLELLLDAAGIPEERRAGLQQAINDLDYSTALELLNE